MVAGPQSPHMQVLFRLYMNGVPIWQPDVRSDVCVGVGVGVGEVGVWVLACGCVN